MKLILAALLAFSAQPALADGVSRTFDAAYMKTVRSSATALAAKARATVSYGAPGEHPAVLREFCGVNLGWLERELDGARYAARQLSEGTRYRAAIRELLDHATPVSMGILEDYCGGSRSPVLGRIPSVWDVAEASRSLDSELLTVRRYASAYFLGDEELDVDTRVENVGGAKLVGGGAGMSGGGDAGYGRSDAN